MKISCIQPFILVRILLFVEDAFVIALLKYLMDYNIENSDVEAHQNTFREASVSFTKRKSFIYLGNTAMYIFQLRQFNLIL